MVTTLATHFGKMFFLLFILILLTFCLFHLLDALVNKARRYRPFEGQAWTLWTNPPSEVASKERKVRTLSSWWFVGIWNDLITHVKRASHLRKRSRISPRRSSRVDNLDSWGWGGGGPRIVLELLNSQISYRFIALIIDNWNFNGFVHVARACCGGFERENLLFLQFELNWKSIGFRTNFLWSYLFSAFCRDF